VAFRPAAPRQREVAVRMLGRSPPAAAAWIQCLEKGNRRNARRIKARGLGLASRVGASLSHHIILSPGSSTMQTEVARPALAPGGNGPVDRREQHMPFEKVDREKACEFFSIALSTL
jgi:hypothetical protein